MMARPMLPLLSLFFVRRSAMMQKTAQRLNNCCSINGFKEQQPMWTQLLSLTIAWEPSFSLPMRSLMMIALLYQINRFAWAQVKIGEKKDSTLLIRKAGWWRTAFTLCKRGKTSANMFGTFLKPKSTSRKPAVANAPWSEKQQTVAVVASTWSRSARCLMAKKVKTTWRKTQMFSSSTSLDSMAHRSASIRQSMTFLMTLSGPGTLIWKSKILKTLTTKMIERGDINVF